MHSSLKSADSRTTQNHLSEMLLLPWDAVAHKPAITVNSVYTSVIGEVMDNYYSFYQNKLLCVSGLCGTPYVYCYNSNGLSPLALATFSTSIKLDQHFLISHSVV